MLKPVSEKHILPITIYISNFKKILLIIINKDYVVLFSALHYRRNTFLDKNYFLTFQIKIR